MTITGEHHRAMEGQPISISSVRGLELSLCLGIARESVSRVSIAPLRIRSRRRSRPPSSSWAPVLPEQPSPRAGGSLVGTTVCLDRTWGLTFVSGSNFSLNTGGDGFGTTRVFSAQPGDTVAARATGVPLEGMRGTFLVFDGTRYSGVGVHSLSFQ